MRIYILTLFFLTFVFSQPLFSQWKTDTTNVASGFTGISFYTPTVGFGTNSTKVFKTIDGGASWNIIKSTNKTFLEDVIVTSNDTVFAFGTYGYIYYTYNSGQTWDSLYLDSAYNLLSAYSFSHDSIWFFGYNFNNTVIFKTGNGCQTIQTDTLINLIGATGFDVLDSGRLLISGMSNGGQTKSVYFSDDNGNSWHPVSSVTANQALKITSFRNNLIMFTGSFGDVYVSQNFGQTFFSRSPSNNVAYVQIIEDSFALAFHDGGNYPKIFRSLNMGDTWAGWNIPFLGNISDVEQPFKQYPELIKVSVTQYPYIYTFCNKVNASLSSSLGNTITCGDTTEISISKHYKYLWNTGETSEFIKATNPGNYWVIAENICGNKDTVNFTLNQVPIQIKKFNDTLICEGDSLVLAANGGTNYSWFDINNNLLSVDSTLQIYPSDSTYIKVLAQDSTTGCFNSDSLQVFVIQKAGLRKVSPDTCIGDSVLFTADTLYGYQYNWGLGNNLNQFNIKFQLNTDTTLKLSTSFSVCAFYDSVFVKPIIPIRNGFLEKDFCFGDTLYDTLFNGIALNLTPAQKGFIFPNNIIGFFPDTTTIYELDLIDSNGCFFKDTVKLVLDTTNKSEVEGFATTNLGFPLQNGQALMIGYNSIDSTVYIEDSSNISPQGTFNLIGKLSDFYLKVVPDFTMYPTQIPTYYQNGAFFFSAIPLQAQCKSHNVSINCIQGLNTNGPGFIAGNVFQGAGKKNSIPWKNLNIILGDSLGNPLLFQTTDSLGKFKFENLPFGVFKLFADNPRFTNIYPQIIRLTIENPNVEGGVFVLSEGSIKLNFIQNVLKPEYTEINLFPNPAKEKLCLSGVHPIEDVTLISKQGIILKYWKGGLSTSLNLDLDEFNTGSYLLKVKTSKYEQLHQISIIK